MIPYRRPAIRQMTQFSVLCTPYFYQPDLHPIAKTPPLTFPNSSNQRTISQRPRRIPLKHNPQSRARRTQSHDHHRQFVTKHERPLDRRRLRRLGPLARLELRPRAAALFSSLDLLRRLPWTDCLHHPLDRDARRRVTFPRFPSPPMKRLCE